MASKNRNTTNKKRPAGSSRKTKTPGKEFPGYPKYPADEDITRQSNRIDENLDDEILTQVKHNQEPKTPKLEADEAASVTNQTPLDEETKSNSKFDLTDEDLEALGPKDLSMDMGDDEQLKHRKRPVDFTGEDLDVPGTDLDDDQEENGSEDEENNIYSLGGDEKNNLEEGQEHEGSL